MSNAFVLFLWRPRDGRQALYDACHVNRLAAMLRAAAPPAWQRVVCVTDDPAGIDASIDTVPAEEALLRAGRRYPKLMLFRGDARKLFGADRLCMVDLDAVVTGPLAPLLDRAEPVVAWADPHGGHTPYNSSMVLLDAGAFPQVYERFDLATADRRVRDSRYIGSDQAWLAIVLGRRLPVWRRADGVLSFVVDCASAAQALGSSIVFFSGRPKPWDPVLDVTHPWAGTAWSGAC